MNNCKYFGNNENAKRTVFIIFKNDSSLSNILSSLNHNGSFQESGIFLWAS